MCPRTPRLPGCLVAYALPEVSLGRINEQVFVERPWVFFATGATGVTYLRNYVGRCGGVADDSAPFSARFVHVYP